MLSQISQIDKVIISFLCCYHSNKPLLGVEHYIRTNLIHFIIARADGHELTGCCPDGHRSCTLTLGLTVSLLRSVRGEEQSAVLLLNVIANCILHKLELLDA